VIRAVPLADMAEAYAAFHRYHPKPLPETPLAPAPRDFMTEMMRRFPDCEKKEPSHEP